MDKKQCRSCGAQIIWIRSAATDNLMPLDAEPTPDGNVAIVDGKAVVFNGTLFEAMLPDGPRYKSHFATCSDPEKHRKKKR